MVNDRDKAGAATMSLQDILGQVRDFHEAFGIRGSTVPSAVIGLRAQQLRFDLMREENEEYLAAAARGDLLEVADALGDMLYILCGTILMHGMADKIEAVFREIQRSNMSKLGADGKPIYREDGKVLKGPAFVPPDIAAALSH